MQTAHVLVIVQVLYRFFGLIDVCVSTVVVVAVVAVVDVMMVEHMGVMLGHVLGHMPEIAAFATGHHMCEVAFCRDNRLPGKYDKQNEEQHLLHKRTAGCGCF